MIKICELPSLGGWLAIGNCLTIASIIGALQLSDQELPNWAFIPAAVVLYFLTFPIACWALLPQLDGGPTYEQIVFQAVIIGVNSIVWGYGMAWVIKRCCRIFSPHEVPIDDAGKPIPPSPETT